MLRDEIARLKGLPPRPPMRQTPSGMEKATGATKTPGPVRRRGPVQERCALTREVVLSVATPPGSQFKGYQDVVVRDLVSPWWWVGGGGVVAWLLVQAFQIRAAMLTRAGGTFQTIDVNLLGVFGSFLASSPDSSFTGPDTLWLRGNA